MKPSLSVLCALAASTLTGCLAGGDCDFDPSTIKVSLLPVTEDVRSLPVLASKKTSLLNINVPDSHGEVRVNVSVENTYSVNITGLRFEQSVDGTQRSIELVAQRLNDRDVQTGNEVESQDKLGFFWRMKNLTEYVLPAARPHNATIAMDWRYAGCGGIRTDTARIEIPGTVKAAASATNLRLVSAEAFAPDLTRGAQVKMSVASAVGDGLTNLKNASYTVTYFGAGALPAIGLGFVDATKIALQSSGTARTSFELGETLDVFSSSNPTASPATYEAAGRAAGAGSFSGGKALVTLTLTSSKKSEPTTTQVDTLTELIDIR
jgi:hypothetical protein